PHSALALLMPIETQYVFGAAETPDWSAPRSASILNLDHVPIGIGEVRVGKSTPVITPHDQPSAKCCEGGDGTFVCLPTGSHIAAMRRSVLYANLGSLTRPHL